MSSNLLTLVMMVKDEAQSIVQSIESCLPHVDRVVILLDERSTDDTPELAREVAGDVPFELYEEPFVDYGTTRNRALELAGTKTTFSLMLSGDETLVRGEELRRHCLHHRDREGDEHGAYMLTVTYSRDGQTMDVPSVRVSRTSGRWRYQGIIHESMVCPGVLSPPALVERASILHVRTETTEQLQATWRHWLRLLESEHAREPDNARTVFLLGQTHHELDQFEQAIGFYEQRASMGGWLEESYEALYRIGDCYEQLGDWARAQRYYLRAHGHHPRRAEPLAALARYYLKRKNWGLAYLFAARAAELPKPTLPLYMESAVYDWEAEALVAASAFRVGEHKRGQEAARKAMERAPSPAALARLMGSAKRTC
jgi:glycosyltransferase involved in cell wall biosynthesis